MGRPDKKKPRIEQVAIKREENEYDPSSEEEESGECETTSRKRERKVLPARVPRQCLGPPRYYIRRDHDEKYLMEPEHRWYQVPEEKVIRPVNRRFFGKNDPPRWGRLSLTNSPTYGLCRECGGSGPMARRCYDCRTDDVHYAWTTMVVKRDDDSIVERAIDAQWIASVMGSRQHQAEWDATLVGDGTYMYSTTVNLNWLKSRLIEKYEDEVRNERRQGSREVINEEAERVAESVRQELLNDD
jgi:hypothetical protein